MQSVGRIVAETGMDWDKAVEMPERVRAAVIDGIEDRFEREAKLEEEKAKMIVKTLTG